VKRERGNGAGAADSHVPVVLFTYGSHKRSANHEDDKAVADDAELGEQLQVIVVRGRPRQTEAGRLIWKKAV
jgi:hypothetical protein